MRDIWDYELRKMEIAWELASRLIPSKVANSGRWTEGTFLKYAQEHLRGAYDVIDTVFHEDK